MTLQRETQHIKMKCEKKGGKIELFYELNGNEYEFIYDYKKGELSRG